VLWIADFVEECEEVLTGNPWTCSTLLFVSLCVAFSSDCLRASPLSLHRHVTVIFRSFIIHMSPKSRSSTVVILDRGLKRRSGRGYNYRWQYPTDSSAVFQVSLNLSKNSRDIGKSSLMISRKFMIDLLKQIKRTTFSPRPAKCRVRDEAPT
jgi:hypothetical protein